MHVAHIPGLALGVVRGAQRFWRYFLPLAVDLCLAAIAWILVPRQFLTPMETIGLFTPDVFLIVVLMTVLGAGWALSRTYLTFHPSQVKGQDNAKSR